jgi:predicted ATPase/DNA-binding SARP family transcriptional activator/DNA-binding CsgD family transcriptional regulator
MEAMTQTLVRTPATASATPLTLSLLGPLRITDDGLPLAFAYDKVQALLVYLAVEANRVHRRAVLADLLWPEHQEAAARHNLSQALFNLRQAVHDNPDNPLLLTTRETVRLNPTSTVWVDVAAFRSLVAATDGDIVQLEPANALYRGEFLEGFSISDSVSFDEWVLLTREQLRTQACALLRRLTEPQTGVGDVARVCEYARRWVALDPLDEAAHRRLMRALAESDQRTAALVQFERCRRLLDEELGIAPEPATIALYEELKQHIVRAAAAPTRPVYAPVPLATTRLIGREPDLEALAAQLADPASRLITITGPGGVGKTRLAVAAAGAARFADGVCYVQLAPVRDPALALAALAQALDVPQNDARPLDELVRGALAQRQLLLLLDNCEHLLPALASLVAELLAAAPQLAILATSRVALRLSQEQRYQLMPLSLPHDGQPPEAQLESAAVALFVERAQAVRPLAELNLAVIGAICRRLDGLPLAIELAATRTRLLSPHELLARLEQRLALLSGGPRDLPERHQALHATIDWSYQLLDPHQQALFRRLAVFADGWTAAAAEAVCADLPNISAAPASVLDGLAALLDASLIGEAANSAGEPRCTMLETIREFAHAQLVAHGELTRAQELHAQYVATLADTVKDALTGAEGAIWTARLEAEHGNLGVALRCAIDCGDAETALRIGRGVWRFWWRDGYAREGLDWLALALASEQVVDAQIRAETLRAAGVLAWAIADYPQAHRWLAQGLELARTLPDRHPEATIYTMLGILARAEGAFARAYTYFGASHAISTTLDDKYAIRFAIMGLAEIDTRLGKLDEAAERYMRCIALNSAAGDVEGIAAAKRRLATVYCLQRHNYAEAESLCAESMALCRAVGDRQGMGQTQLALGNLARDQGDDARAIAHYQQSLLLRAQLEQCEDCAQTLEELAVSLGHIGQEERAVQLVGGADQIRGDIQAPLTAFEQGTLDESVATWRARLGAATFDHLWRCGQALTFGQMTRLALSAAPTPASVPAANQQHARPGALPDVDADRVSARARPGDKAFAAALEEGMARPVGTVIAEALVQSRDEPEHQADTDRYDMPWGEGTRLTTDTNTTNLRYEVRAALDAAAEATHHLLTAREHEILHLMAAGLTNPQIAAQLVIGAGTVKTHTLNIYRKLEVANRTQAIVRAQELGFLRA